MNDKEVLDHPFKTGIKYHRYQWLDIKVMVLSWGVCVLALFGEISLRLILILAVSYGSMLMAADSKRLFQWAFPVVILSAIAVIPLNYMIPLVILHLFNPYNKYYEVFEGKIYPRI